MISSPRILFYDTETAPAIVASFGLYNQNHSYSQVYQDWFFLCAQWAWDHENKVHSKSIIDDPWAFKEDHTNDFYVVKALYEQIEKADIIVAHNNDGFDWRRFMTKVVEHNLPPIKMPHMVDTLKEARNFAFLSNKLGDLNIKLGLKAKLDTSPGLWPRAATGDVEAIEKIVKYGRGDIPALRSLYHRLRPYMKNHPNFNVFKKEDCCPNCGSVQFQCRGFQSSKTMTYQRYQCSNPSCGKWFKGRAPVQKANMR